MIGILIAVLLAALVYFLCVALGLPAIVAIVAAILVLLAGIPTRGDGVRGLARAVRAPVSAEAGASDAAVRTHGGRRAGPPRSGHRARLFQARLHALPE